MPVIGIVKRSPVVCLLLAGMASPAFADDLTITSILTAPVTTSHASNGSAGNITIDATGGVSVVTEGAAVTIDSSNTVESSGVIQNAAVNNAIGVHILGGSTGSFITDATSTSIVNVGGGGTGNFGVLVDGSSPFTGNITLTTGSSIVVTGANASGIAIKTPLNGGLLVGATTAATGVGSTGVLVLAPINGALDLTFGVSAVGTGAFTLDKIDPLSGPAVAVGSNVSGGIVNDGPATATTIANSSTLVAVSNMPTLAIQPSIAGTNAADIVIGTNSSDTVNPTFSLINRGAVRSTVNDPGINTIGVGIGELGTATHTVTLTGGIYNRGSIQAQAESDNSFATSAPSASATATALLIGNGATINASNLSTVALFTEGAISASETGNMPGTATAVLIQPGGTLASLNNTGSITSIVTTTDTTIASLTSYGVRDLSGTLRTVTNSGTWNAEASPLANGAQTTVAADLSHTSAAETFTNSGSVVGDILFGSGANQLTIEGAAASGSCTVACVQGSVRAAGSGTINVQVSAGGTGGSFRTANAQLSSLTVGNAGVVEFAVNKNSTTTPFITTTGATTFSSGSKATVVPTSFLPASGSYTLIHANGGLTFADFTAATAQPIPFIFNGSIAQQGNDLVLTLQRKTAAEIGLTGNAAAMYEPLATAALNDDQFGATLLSFSTAGDVKSALATVVPDIAGGVRALSIAMTDQATGVIGARERALVTAPQNMRDEFRFWGQEFYNNVSGDSTVVAPGYSGAGQGVAVGVEWGSLSTVRYGLGYTFFSSEETEAHPLDTKTNGDWNLVSAYAGWRSGDFFVTPQANLGFGTFQSRRTIVAGSLVRAATANWNSYLAAGGLTTGYVFDVGDFQIIPQVALDGLYLREGTYNETGASGIGLSLKEQGQQSVRTFAGVVGQGAYSWNNGNLQPQLLVGWSHEFMDNPATIDGTFEAAPGSPFHLVGPTVEPNKIIGGASFAYIVGNWSAGINYDASASTGTLAQSATISLSSRF
ncbi:MAG TPA: autotransporter domain-containing protein [Micropepsaceae bacterium]|nr:autotransporter domain-containing protein [Micropepsaceae bacterium]